MNSIWSRQISTLCQDLFLASFGMLWVSGFLEFFYPGIISFYINSAWLFALTFFFGLLYMIVHALFYIPKKIDTSSHFYLNIARVTYILFALLLIVALWRVFAPMRFLQIVILLGIIITTGVVYGEFFLKNKR